MSTIEERIAKHERLAEKARNIMSRAGDTIDKARDKLNYHENSIAALKVRLAKQQAKDQVTGKALVESGAITEAQKEAIEKLPLPEGQTAQRLPREKVE